jgi:hypothetical protein
MTNLFLVVAHSMLCVRETNPSQSVEKKKTYYFDGDRNLSVYVKQPDDTIAVGKNNIYKGTNRIKGTDSTDLNSIRNKFITEVHKNENESSRKMDMVQIFDDTIDERTDEGGKLQAANDMLYDVLEDYYIREKGW